jgi:hypothetical protein
MSNLQERREEKRRRERQRLHTESLHLQKLRDRIDEDHRVLSIPEWCGLNGFSLSTGQRILKGKGPKGRKPKVVQLSERRIGITPQANREWQEDCARE